MIHAGASKGIHGNHHDTDEELSPTGRGGCYRSLDHDDDVNVDHDPASPTASASLTLLKTLNRLRDLTTQTDSRNGSIDGYSLALDWVSLRLPPRTRPIFSFDK